MKTVKQILETHDKTKVSVSSMEQSIMNLVRSGLLEENKTHILRRSLIKDPSMLTVAEKRIVLDVLGELITEKDHLTKADKAQDNTSTELPSVIILKRKAIRVYPDKQKIGLYYSQALDKYISIPYGPSNKNISAQITEESDPQMLEEETQEPATQYATIEESFDAKLKRIREARVLEEGEYTDTAKAVARGAASTVTMGHSPKIIAGIKTLKKKIAGQETDYDKDLADEEEAQKKAEEEHPTASKVGNVLGGAAALATGGGLAVAGVKAGAKALAGKTAVEVAKGAARSTARGAGKAVVGGAKLVKKAVTGGVGAAANAVKGVAGAVGDAASLFQRTNDQHDRQYNLGQRQLGTVSNTNRISTDPSAAIAQRYAFGVTNSPSGRDSPRSQNESNLTVLKNMVENNISNCTITFGDNSISINNRMAKKLVKVHESLNRKNKKNMERMLNESATSFTSVVNFSVRQ